MSKQKLWIFDYDDTLAWNHHDYSFAQLKFVDFIINRLGIKAPDVSSIIEGHIKIDMELVSKHGFGKEHFPNSFVELYKRIRKDLELPRDEEGEKYSYKIGMSAYDEERYKKLGLLPGVKETLEFLLSKGDKLSLYTKGDFEIQSKKIKATNSDKYFGNNIYITLNNKTAEGYKEIANNHPIKYTYSVGNSIRSDINPSTKAGIKAIYIPVETWAYERIHNGFTDPERVITLNNISEIIDIYDKL